MKGEEKLWKLNDIMENIWNKRLCLLLVLEVDSDSESDSTDELQSDRTDWVSQYHRFLCQIFVGNLFSCKSNYP